MVSGPLFGGKYVNSKKNKGDEKKCSYHKKKKKIVLYHSMSMFMM